jgi:hypothetical protein
MKKLLILAVIFGLTLTTFSCQDMMETDSDRQVFDPSLDEKTDSMFYTLGILAGVQNVIDQYVLVGEMRGDLTRTNSYTETDLRELANFSVSSTNKYDSAYVWYRIINNCNYYIAHRDTTLRTGSRQVAINEYVQALSIRAWAYMQLAKTYGSVPFYTTPITSIGDANAAANGEKKDLQGIVDALAPELAKWSGTPVPSYGTIDAGSTNFGSSKQVNSRRIMFPVDLVLGDMYLETNQYEKAANSYFTYIKNNNLRSLPYIASPSRGYHYPNNLTVPNDYSSLGISTSSSWSLIFAISNPYDVITYVPMAVNKLYGTTTNLPKLFGWNYYTTDVDTAAINNGTATYNASALYVKEREIDPSQQYIQLCNSQNYYYRPSGADETTTTELGDQRRYATLDPVSVDDSSFYVMTKYEGGNINIYRGSTVYLRLAEALNRMGYPDAAFAILKDGIGATQLQTAGYLRDTTRTMLTKTIPFLSSQYTSIFDATSSTTVNCNRGIHTRGCGYTMGQYSGYTYNGQIYNKLSALNNAGLTSIELTSSNDTLYNDAAIEAVEDLLCDEYAMELGFEGNRFGDLCRLARHKNASSFNGSNYGGRWLAYMLRNKNAAVDLTNENNWYMPYR